MAISKVYLNSDVQIDITDTTATVDDVINKYFYGADGVKRLGTASGGGGGGLVYETGTYTPAADTSNVTITFSGSHSLPPIFCLIVDTDNDYSGVNVLALEVATINYWVPYVNISFNNNTIAYRYLRYRNGSSDSQSGTSVPTISTYLTNSSFIPFGTSTSFYCISGRTYKWIAVWSPT